MHQEGYSSLSKGGVKYKADHEKGELDHMQKNTKDTRSAGVFFVAYNPDVQQKVCLGISD